MKTWEVYKIALENPKVKFRRINNGKVIYSGPHGLFYDDKTGSSCHIVIDDEWELVREPVDFMTAVKAFHNGKTIKCEWDKESIMIYEPGIDICAEMKDQDGGGLSADEIISGKWYIED